MGLAHTIPPDTQAHWKHPYFIIQTHFSQGRLVKDGVQAITTELEKGAADLPPCVGGEIAIHWTGEHEALPRETGGAAAVWKGRTTMPDITAVTHAQNIRYDRKAEALTSSTRPCCRGRRRRSASRPLTRWWRPSGPCGCGAPAIGICAAYCMYVLAKSIRTEDRPTFLKRLSDYGQQLDAARPTAVNLGWAIREMMRTALEHVHDTRGQMLDALYERAVAIHEDDIAKCRAISEYGLSLLKEGDGVLTHCNAGPLATSRYGTAQGPFLLAAERGMHIRYSRETRPCSSARLTSYELQRAGVDVTLICDNMAPLS